MRRWAILSISHLRRPDNTATCPFADRAIFIWCKRWPQAHSGAFTLQRARNATSLLSAYRAFTSWRCQDNWCKRLFTSAINAARTFQIRDLILNRRTLQKASAGLTTKMDKSWFRLHPWRTGMLVFVLWAAGYFVSLCLPHGYRQLEQLESQLQQLTPQGARIADVRTGLSSQGIEYREWVQESAGPLLSDGSGVKISANPGENVILSRHPTEAWQFLCSEQLDIILVFDEQKLLIRRYIGRF